MEKTFEGLWIPTNILSNQNLTANEKLVLSIIKALDKGKGCYASNKYIAKLIGLEQRSMSKIIKSLKDKNCVEVDIEGYNERTIKYTFDIEQDKTNSKVIQIEKKRIIYNGIDITDWGEEAIQRVKKYCGEGKI